MPFVLETFALQPSALDLAEVLSGLEKSFANFRIEIRGSEGSEDLNTAMFYLCL